MEKKVKKSKKTLFVQDLGIFGDEMFVAVGLSYDEIVKGAKKLGAVKLFFENIKDAKDNYWDERFGQDDGFVLIDNNNHAFLLWLKKYEDTWGFWEKVLHEVVHIVQALERSKLIQKEDECRAYTTEYVFHHLRRKLMGIEKSESINF